MSSFTSCGDAATSLEWALQQRNSFSSQNNYEQMPVVFSRGSASSGELKSFTPSCFHRPKQEQCLWLCCCTVQGYSIHAEMPRYVYCV